MLISTKGRYALRVMIDLAQNDTGSYISLKDVAERQNISMKYLEIIVSLLNKGEMLESLRGKSGGYRLAYKPSEYTIYSILTLTEGSLVPVNCLERDAKECERAKDCITLPLWKKLDYIVADYLKGVTLEDVMKGNV